MLRISRTGLVLAIVAILVSAALVLVVNATADAQEYDSYVVKKGDVISRIAAAHGLTVPELMELNNLTSPILIRRQVLKVPARATQEPVAEQIAPDPTEIAAEETEATETEAEETATEEMVEEAATEEPTAEATEEPAEEMATEEMATEEPTEEPAAEATVEAPTVETTPQPEGAPASTATPDVSGTATDGSASAGETMTETVETAEEPVAAVEAWASPENGVQIFSPAAGGAYHSPIDISGLTGALEGEIVIRLIDSADEPYAQRTVAVNSPESADFFDTYLRFSVTEPVPATLEVTAGNAEPIEVPVILLPGQRFIDLHLPTDGAAVCSPITVAGYSSTFEANVVVEITDADGMQLAQEPTIGGSMGVYSEFSIALDQSADEPQPLIVAAYETDASGMYPSIDRTAVPVTLYPAGSAACP